MEQAQLNWIANFIWGIADDVLRDLYVRGKYRDVILPMTVLRRFDAVLEPTKQQVLDKLAGIAASLDARAAQARFAPGIDALAGDLAHLHVLCVVEVNVVGQVVNFDPLDGLAGRVALAHRLEQRARRREALGDEVELHRRLVRSGLPFGTCLDATYVHPCGTDEFKPILGGRMHTQYPDDATKRFFTYRNRGYLLSQPGLRRLLPQEWVRFGWYFLVSRRDPAGLGEWIRLRRLGREERFGRPGT